MFVGPVYWDSFFLPSLWGMQRGVVYIWIEWLRAQERRRPDWGGRKGEEGDGEPGGWAGLCVWWGEVM